jgi:hypothetical protein
MSKFQLFSDIAAPVVKRGAPKNEYPLGVMSVGQAFFIDRDSKITAEKQIERIKASIARWKKSNDKKSLKFVVAETDNPDTTMGGRVIGVWRNPDEAPAEAQGTATA